MHAPPPQRPPGYLPAPGGPHSYTPTPAYPAASYAPLPPPRPAPAPSRTHPAVFVVVSMLLMLVLAGVVGTCGSAVAVAVLDDETLQGASGGGSGGSGAPGASPSGVLPGTQVPEPTVKKLRERQLLGASEVLVAYHDASAQHDMSELSLITTERVVHASEIGIAAARFPDVVNVVRRSLPQGVDMLEIDTRDGKRIHVTIALGGGEAFARALEDVWRRTKPGARIMRDED